jgi:hypothetical protein
MSKLDLRGLRKAAAVSALALAATIAPAQEPATGNVQFTIALGEVDQGPLRTYRLVGALGETSRMIVGFRTPIPTERSGEEGGPAATAFVYQNVGMTAVLRPLLESDRRLRVTGQIEVSGSRPSELTNNPEGMPVIGTFQQDVDVYVELGKPLRLAEGPGPEGGQRYIELTATLLD